MGKQQMAGVVEKAVLMQSKERMTAEMEMETEVDLIGTQIETKKQASKRVDPPRRKRIIERKGRRGTIGRGT